jgi:hypothetical protein
VSLTAGFSKTPLISAALHSEPCIADAFDGRVLWYWVLAGRGFKLNVVRLCQDP